MIPLPKTAIKVSLLLGGFGLLLSRPFLLNFVNNQNPIFDFFLFKRVDPTTFRYGIGAIMLYFAAGIVFYWPASQYALTTVGASPVGAGGTPPFLLASEDQITYEIWHFLLPFASNDVL